MNTQEKIVINPYNPINKLLSQSWLESILQFSIQDLSIYQQAFVHTSYTKKIDYSTIKDCPKVLSERPSNCLELFKQSNERLEFFGDSVLGLVVTKYLYQRFSQDEGWSTKIKTKLVNTTMLAKLCRDIGLENYLIISRHVEDRCNGRQNDRILEDLFESLIGAIYLEQNRQTITSPSLSLTIGIGYHRCEQFIIRLLETYVDFTELIHNDTNYKDILLRYYQQTYHITPKYVEVDVQGPSHQRIFTMGVYSPTQQIIGKGTERSKKKAEQLASKQALSYYGMLQEDSSDDDSSEE